MKTGAIILSDSAWVVNVRHRSNVYLLEDKKDRKFGLHCKNELHCIKRNAIMRMMDHYAAVLPFYCQRRIIVSQVRRIYA